MHKISRSRRMAQRLAMVAPLVALSTTTFAATPSQPTIKLPDFSAYDCTTVSSTIAPSVRHVGQVIKGNYNEWHAFYAAVGDKRRLICISLDKPTARQLTAAEAREFLTASTDVSAPADTARSAAASETEPLPDATPEPLLRVQDTQATKAAPESSTTELPPRGVVHVPSPADADVKVPKSEAVTKSEAPATLGVDERKGVPNTGAYPWNTVGFLVVTYSDNASFRCSGVLVSANTVLTAGHCVHNKNRGGFPIRARFTAGLGPLSGNSGTLNNVTSYNTTQAWMDISGNDSYPVTDFKNDIAAIKFSDSISVSTFMPVVFSDTSSPVTSAGYPAVVGGQSWQAEFYMTGPERTPGLRPYHVREFSIDASGGNSGGPFFYTDPDTGQNFLVGLLSYGDDVDDRAGGPWYDSWNQPILAGWMGRILEQPSAVVGGVQVPSVFSSARNDVQSFFRFFNNSNVAGTVDVTIYNGDTGATLGTWRSPSIPAYASPQFAVKTFESLLSIPNKPQFYTLSVKPTFSGYLQHVVWQTGPNTLQNLTTCSAGVTTQPYLLMNVHSGALQSTFPGWIMIQNTGSTPIAPTLTIREASGGRAFSTYTPDPIPPHALRGISTKDMETAIHFDPTSAGIYWHYIITTDAFSGYLQQISIDASSGKVNDMTAMCAMNP